MQNRKSPERPVQPMRSAPRDGEAAQGQEARRSGQLARLTEEIRAGGETKACRDEAALVGGDRKHASRQACSRPHYQTGQVRLPGGSGLEGADLPGRRRADARYERRRASFGSLQFHGDEFGKATIINPCNSATLCSVDSTHPITRRNRTPAAHSLCCLVPDANVGCEVSNGWP